MFRDLFHELTSDAVWMITAVLWRSLLYEFCDRIGGRGLDLLFKTLSHNGDTVTALILDKGLRTISENRR